MRHTFKAYERLKREQHIDTLFRTGKAFSVSPIKFIYLSRPKEKGEESPVRAGFSIPKKKFRKAADRNRVKRLLREAWRLHKHELYESIPPELQMHIFLIHTGTDIPKYEAAALAVQKGIAQLAKQQVKHA